MGCECNIAQGKCGVDMTWDMEKCCLSITGDKRKCGVNLIWNMGKCSVDLTWDKRKVCVDMRHGKMWCG
jgi:hypothetical protein